MQLLCLLLTILVVLLSEEHKHSIQRIESFAAEVLPQLFLLICTFLNHSLFLRCCLGLLSLIERRLRLQLEVSIKDLVVHCIDLLDLLQILIISHLKVFKVLLNLNLVHGVSRYVVGTTSIDGPVVLLIHLVVHHLMAFRTLWHGLP